MQGLLVENIGREPARRQVVKVPSLIKWSGSKRSQVPYILANIPKHERYIEPFLGSGALLYAAGREGSLAADIYDPLIQLWILVQRNPNIVVENYASQWRALQKELNSLDVDRLPKGEALPNYYYLVRNRFNQKNDPLDLNFLLRTCVNGIVRFNASGNFNNSFHLTRRGMDPIRFRQVIKDWNYAIRGVIFKCQDYEETISEARSGDFVYLDPPYAGNKQRYLSDLDLVRFFSALDLLNTKGVKWALSFDGYRGKRNLVYDVPSGLYKRHMLIPNGGSAVSRVLNGPIEAVWESLYLNF